MMIHVYEIATGRLIIPCTVQDEATADLQAASQEMQCLWVHGNWDGEREYVFEGGIVPRPLLDWPGHEALSALPRGSVVTVANEVGDTLRLTDLSDPLILTDPGTYRFDIVPPFPYLPRTVEVDHA